MHLQPVGFKTTVCKRYLSLIEVLISLALVGLCVGVLFYGLQKNLHVTVKHAKEAKERYTYHFLQQKLGRIFYALENKKYSFFFTEKGFMAPFHGDHQLLTAGYSSAKNVQDSKNIKMFCLYVDFQNRLQLLKVEGKKKELETLCEEVESISYLFFNGLAVQKDPSDSGWIDHWEKGQEKFPQAIQVVVKTKEADLPLFFLINEKNVTAEVF